MLNILNKDSRQLILFIVVVAIVWLFVELSFEVFAGSSAAIDEKIVLAFREPTDLSDPIGPKWIEEMMRDITGLGGVGILVFISLLTLMYLLIDGKNKVALIFFVAVSTGLLLSFSLKYGFTRPRPDLVPHGSYVYTSSFPSGHAMMSSLIYLTMAGMLSQLPFRRSVKIYFFIIAIVLTVSIGISRVYLGVHWPTDVLAGWLGGAGWALLTLFIIRLFKVMYWIGPDSEDNPDQAVDPPKVKN